MTYDEAEKLANDNLDIIKRHNEYLSDKFGYRIKETIIAPINSNIDTISKIYINLTHRIDNRKSISVLGFDFDNEQYDVFLFTEFQGSLFSSHSLNAYLDGLGKT